MTNITVKLLDEIKPQSEHIEVEILSKYQGKSPKKWDVNSPTKQFIENFHEFSKTDGSPRQLAETKRQQRLNKMIIFKDGPTERKTGTPSKHPKLNVST